MRYCNDFVQLKGIAVELDITFTGYFHDVTLPKIPLLTSLQ